MGCTQSSKVDIFKNAVEGIANGPEAAGNPKSGFGETGENANDTDGESKEWEYSSGGLTEGDIHKRMVSSKNTEVLHIDTEGGGSYTARFAYVSQRGYYPNEPNKANQDAFRVVPQFCNDPSSLLCGVFDGHGMTGDLCSSFVAKELPTAFEEALKARGVYLRLTEKDVKAANLAAHEITNMKLHGMPVDDTLSGTTAITVLLKGDTLFVANVGDSRAIMCSRTEEGDSEVRPLSVDQTPFRRDERERIKRAGGHVLTIDQLEGLEPIHENWDTQLGEELDEIGDPPRVWLASLDQPGCAFTRSLGDAVGESVGVFAEPEQLVVNITKNDRFIVIASDGVFEFITSNKVLEDVEMFNDPLEAGKYVVQEAFRTWLRYEVRTDDITIIVIFLEDFQEGTNTEASVCVKKQRESATFMAESVRPVRRYFSKEAKNRLIREAAVIDNDDQEPFDVAANEVPKTPEEMTMISRIVQDIFLFQHLTQSQINDVIKVMSREQVRAGDVVISQGEEGDRFYIVDTGEYDVSVTDHKGKDTVVSHISHSGEAFGELSLMYGKPRTATVKCVADGFVWTLERRAFRGILVKRMAHDNTIRILRKVKMLELLSMLQLQKLCDVMVEERYSPDTPITTEGEIADKFYIILQGEVKCYIGTGNGREEVTRIGPSGYFGERALLYEEPRKVSFFSSEVTTNVLALRRSDMETIIGPLQHVIDQADARAAKGEVVKEHDAGLARDLKGTVASDLEYKAWSVQLGHSTFIGLYRHKRLGKTFAVKVSSKCKLVTAHSAEGILLERTILDSFVEPNVFVPTQLCTLKDDKCLYSIYKERIVCELAAIMEGGSLNEELAKFYAACVNSAILHLHHEGYIHRSVTPHCVYITQDGQAQLADLTCAKKMEGNKAYTLIGDPHYFAPEHISGQGYGMGVDYWALGILLYEMMHLETPFASHETETKVYQSITAFTPEDLRFSDQVSAPCQAITIGLLAPRADDRLGSAGGREILEHPFFAGFSWDKLEGGSLPAPLSGEEVLAQVGDRSEVVFEAKEQSTEEIDATFSAF